MLKSAMSKEVVHVDGELRSRGQEIVQGCLRRSRGQVAVPNGWHRGEGCRRGDAEAGGRCSHGDRHDQVFESMGDRLHNSNTM
jgi:hypothetical protein